MREGIEICMMPGCPWTTSVTRTSLEPWGHSPLFVFDPNTSVFQVQRFGTILTNIFWGSFWGCSGSFAKQGHP